MEFRLLGVLEVEGEHGRVRIVPGRESALLALLLVRNEPLSTDRIIDELWGEAPPENAGKSVQIYVSRLRKALGPARIETTPAGYRIMVTAGECDIQQFEEALGRGALSAALCLWRGEPLADFRYAPFAQAEARRLEELHDAAVADLLDERLARGETPTADLEALIARTPLWERPRGQLMRALYLAGRQADALELYRQTHSLLGRELGVEPGPELQRLERAILNHDPELGSPPPPPRPVAPRRGRGLLLGGGLLLVVAAAAAVIVISTRKTTGLETIAAGTVGAIDPRTNRIVAQIGVGNRPSRLAVAGNRLWVMNAGDRTISEIDTKTDREVANFGPNVVPADLAADPSNVWVGASDHGTPSAVVRFDATRRSEIGVTRLPGRGPTTNRPTSDRYLIEGGGHVFAIGPTLHPVEISSQTGMVTRVYSTEATSLAYGAGALWGIDNRSVVRIDPATGIAKEFPVSSLFDLSGIAFGAGFVWATSPGEGIVWRIDPRPPGQTISIPLSFGAATIAYGDGSLWVGNTFDDSISRIDPATRAVSKVAIIPAPQDIVIEPHHVWVASGSTAGRSGPLVSSACGAMAARSKTPDLVIASDFALRGGGSAVAGAAVATIERVLSSRGYRAGRFSVGYQSCDDSTPSTGGYDDGQCLANASSYAVDTSVVGVIGTSDSGCALDEIPTANRAPNGPLAVVSPFDTGPFLTRRGFPAAAQTLAQFYAAGPRNFFRTIGADHIQTAADAAFARRLGLRRVGVLFNRQGMLQVKEEQWFLHAASRLGGVRAVPILWNGGQRSLAAKIEAAHVDGVFLVSFVVSSPAEAAATAKTLGSVLAGKPVIVTDAFEPWGVTSGSRAQFYASTAGLVRASQLPTRIRKVIVKLPRADRIPFAVSQAYAAISALLDGIARSDGSRLSIVKELRKDPMFDRFGDPRTAPVSIFRIGVAGTARLVTTVTPQERTVPAG